MHSFVAGLLTRDIPIANPEAIVSIVGSDANGSLGAVSYDDYAALKEYRDTFEWVGAARESQATITLNGRSSITPVAAVSSELAGLIQISPDKGVVVSHRLLQNELGLSTEAIHKTLHIDDADLAIVGVAPEWLDGLYLDRPIDVWTPFDADGSLDADRDGR